MAQPTQPLEYTQHRPRLRSSTRPIQPLSDPASEEWLTTQEVCDKLRIKKSTFYDWRQKGKAPTCLRLPNGDLLISRTELNRFLLSRMEGTA